MTKSIFTFGFVSPWHLVCSRLNGIFNTSCLQLPLSEKRNVFCSNPRSSHAAFSFVLSLHGLSVLMLLEFCMVLFNCLLVYIIYIYICAYLYFFIFLFF